MTKLLISSILLYLLAYPAQAVILLGQDNNANQTDPGTGVPWDAVGKVTNSDGSGIQGSAIYLGEGFLLTANHVAMNLTYSFITFDEANYFSIDPNFNDGTRTYGKQVATGVDMAVIKLISTPTTPPVAASLLTTNTESFGATDSATLVGWGVGRDPSSPVGSGSITWGGVETSAKRWGVNAPRASGPVGYTLAGIDYTFESVPVAPDVVKTIFELFSDRVDPLQEGDTVFVWFVFYVQNTHPRSKVEKVPPLTIFDSFYGTNVYF